MVDGSRREGSTLTGWHDDDAEPALDGAPLLATDNPLRWFRDQRRTNLDPRSVAGPYLEFVGGDRLPGRLTGYTAASPTGAPGFLAVRTVVDLPASAPQEIVMRVLPECLKRIVLRGEPSAPLRPGTVRTASGVVVPYRKLRWSSDGISLLTDQGTRDFRLDELLSIDLPQAEFWPAYFQQLARVSPQADSRLVRLETIDGLLLTTSGDCLRRAALGSNDDVDRWVHLVQPAWSLDPLVVPFRGIRTRSYFQPEEVPLSRVPPAEFEQHSLLGRGWRWQPDRNVAGGPLIVRGTEFGWGIGVHASCQLKYRLPDCASEFQTSVALDRLANRGGCAQATVSVEGEKDAIAFDSGTLLGMQPAVSSGRLPLPASARHLVLQTDATPADAPDAADPLDVRDLVDWLQPTLHLDRRQLKNQVRKLLPGALPDWGRWQVVCGGDEQLAGVTARPQWAGDDPWAARCRWEVISGDAPVCFSSERLVEAGDRWLWIDVRRRSGPASGGVIEVRVDGSVAGRFAPPAEDESGSSVRIVSLAKYQGRRVRIEVAHRPQQSGGTLVWSALRLIDRPTRTRWAKLDVSTMQARGGKLHSLADGSILASDENTPDQQYTLFARSPLRRITAIRLEALPHPSLPKGGPGRGVAGRFVLNRFRAALLPAEREHISARYLRIELPGSQRICSLAEVQAFRGAVNLAPDGKATQSSLEPGGDARWAIDRRTPGNVAAGDRVTFTRLEDDPWWELDFGRSTELDRLVIWNRTDGGFEQRLGDFRVSLRDQRREPVWSKSIRKPPRPSVTLLADPPEEMNLVSVESDGAARDYPAGYLLTGPAASRYGWSTDSGGRRAHVVVFRLAEPVDVAESEMVLRLSHFHQHDKFFDEPIPNLGRFRLSVTGDEGPIAAESVPLEIAGDEPSDSTAPQVGP